MKEIRTKDKKSRQKSEFSVLRGPLNSLGEPWAPTLIVLRGLFVRLITSRCQLQHPGATRLKNAQAVHRLPGSGEKPAGPGRLWASRTH